MAERIVLTVCIVTVAVACAGMLTVEYPRWQRALKIATAVCGVGIVVLLLLMVWESR